MQRGELGTNAGCERARMPMRIVSARLARYFTRYQPKDCLVCLPAVSLSPGASEPGM